MHPALMEKSGWTYSPRLRQLKAARWWGCDTPTTFDEMSKSEKLDIMAAYEEDWRENAVNQYEAQKKAEREAKGRK